MTFLSRLIFEYSPFDPLITSLMSGYAAIGFDMRVYLTPAGAEYLESCS